MNMHVIRMCAHFIKDFTVIGITHEYCFAAVVLNEKQRVAKRKLIEENRARRRSEHVELPEESPEKPDNNVPIPEGMTDNDRRLISSIITAYEYTSAKITNNYSIVSPLFIYKPENIFII